MRLLNTNTIELEEFPSEVPYYAILSHTWGKGEVLFDDARHGLPHLRKCGKQALDKVLGSCRLAREHGYSYIWIDTCCIDKSSSSELSEAINSMFEWYRCAEVCYVFLEDFPPDYQTWMQGGERTGYFDLSGCRWLKRGWTLQELLAPFNVRFYDKEWDFVGDRISLAKEITRCTGISLVALVRHATEHCSTYSMRGRFRTTSTWCETCQTDISIRAVLESFSISRRMNWAANRRTTRPEDDAYSLMGIFNVNMPLLYGEGTKAFQRLQQEIVKVSQDQTILAWEYSDSAYRSARFDLDAMFSTVPLLAPSPAAFTRGYDMYHLGDRSSEMTLSVGGNAMQIEVWLGECVHELQWFYYAALDCQAGDDPLTFTVILLQRLPSSQLYVRKSVGSEMLFLLGDEGLKLHQTHGMSNNPEY